MSGPVERFETTRGSLVHIEAAGSGSPVLALHGVGGGAYFFRGLAERLAPSHRVIALDLPGTGSSTAAQPTTIDTWVADIGEVVREYIGEPVPIIGHSLGTILALRAWKAWPEHVRGLAFVGGLPEPRPLIKARLGERISSIRRDGLEGWGRRVASGVFGPRALVERLELVGMFERLFEAQDVTSYLHSLELLVGASASEVVSGVGVPCLSISGSDDQYAPPESVAAFCRQLPGSPGPIVLEGTGHLPFFEAPQVFARHISAFLASLRAVQVN